MIKNPVLKILLNPFAFLYGVIVSFRNMLYDFHLKKTYEFPDHIINVGNLSVGGTGKTPVVEYLIKLLKDNGFNVIVISRGYKRKLGGLTVATENPDWQIIGDEPAQIKWKFPDVNVVVCANRIEAIKYSKENLFVKDKKNVIILDDAYQYRKIIGTFNILLMDINRMVYNNYYLPVGTLRDSPNQIKRANIILLTKCKKELKPMEKRIYVDKLNLLYYQKKAYFSKIKYKDLVPAFKDSYVLKLKNINPDYHILLVTAIAKPEYLVDFLKTKTPNITHIKFSDHHEFDIDDIIEINNRFGKIRTPKRLILTTEKDFMRLRTTEGVDYLKDYPVYYLPIENDFLTEEEKEMFNQQILDYVRKNYTLGKLH
jgi:tetraacyldisaccharide 4'-kinase